VRTTKTFNFYEKEHCEETYLSEFLKDAGDLTADR